MTKEVWLFQLQIIIVIVCIKERKEIPNLSIEGWFTTPSLQSMETHKLELNLALKQFLVILVSVTAITIIEETK